MQVEYVVWANNLRRIPEQARHLEDLGFDQVSAPEAAHDAFFPLLLAAEHTERVKLGTSIAVSFPRSPAVMAQLAWDLAAFSGGRFRLGLGPQVKGHNVRRFSVPWGPPVPRMREYIQMTRAVWNTWQTGAKPDYRGDHYQFTLMVPFFNPGPIDHPNIPIYIAAVGPLMNQLVGELCDGVRLHPLLSEKYLREVVRPNVEIGLRKSGRTIDAIDFCWDGFLATGPDRAAVEAAKQQVRQRIGFYSSTPNYAGVLDVHGWGDHARRLQMLSREQKWDEITNSVTDEMVETFAVCGTYDELPDRFGERFGGLVSMVHLSLTPREVNDDKIIRPLVERFKALK